MIPIPEYVSNQIPLSIGILLATASNVRVLPVDESKCYVSMVIGVEHLATIMADKWEFYHFHFARAPLSKNYIAIWKLFNSKGAA